MLKSTRVSAHVHADCSFHVHFDSNLFAMCISIPIFLLAHISLSPASLLFYSLTESTDFVIVAISGYNGAFDNDKVIPGEKIVPDHVTEMRIAEYGERPDGKNYTWPKDIVPYRIYVGRSLSFVSSHFHFFASNYLTKLILYFHLGIKGKLEDGSDAPSDDFLARNGFKYGQIYGFAIDMTNSTDQKGPTEGVWRDEFHKSATNGNKIEGKWIAQPWRWNGEVKNFQHDGSWDYQVPPPGTEAGGELEGYFWWLSKGPDSGGCKTEHLSPDPRPGKTAFVQSSTCGYFGHLYVLDVEQTLAGGDLPQTFDGEYYVYQGETDITSQVRV